MIEKTLTGEIIMYLVMWIVFHGGRSVIYKKGKQEVIYGTEITMHFIPLMIAVGMSFTLPRSYEFYKLMAPGYIVTIGILTFISNHFVIQSFPFKVNAEGTELEQNYDKENVENSYGMIPFSRSKPGVSVKKYIHSDVRMFLVSILLILAFGINPLTASIFLIKSYRLINTVSYHSVSHYYPAVVEITKSSKKAEL